MGTYYKGIVKNEYTRGIRFGKNLKILRIRSGLTCQALGETVDMSGAALAVYEREEALPTLYSVIKIARYFGVTIDDMVYAKLGDFEVLLNAQRKWKAAREAEGLRQPDDLDG